MNKAEFIQLLPMLFMLVFAGGFVSLTMFITHRLGPSRKTQIKLESFECGIESQGNARNPMPIRYFLVAILFVLFDVEIIFMYPWAVNFKELGIQGFVEMLVFIAILFIGFIYIIKRGALKWTN
ncbi:MAG: NADH-quinone oxidoreductase subunit A [Saprospiraceae bacterium]